MKLLELENISKKYTNSDQFAVNSISLSVNKGEILALVGESGSGKTTLLRLIAGLEHPDQGIITLDKNVIVHGQKSMPANLRKIGMVFQDYALFPHMTIWENIAYGLSHIPKADRKSRITETLKIVDLKENTTKYPHQLSGGQQQRVALARAIAPQPNILLLDEPFSNLDSILRDQVREEVKSIIKKLGITALLVTHDTKDALSTADKIAVMNNGELLQLDRPETLYEHPTNPYVAQLFGKYTILSAGKSSEGLVSPFGTLCADNLNITEENINIFFRPENTMIADLNYANLKGKIIAINYQGDQIMLSIKPLDGADVRAEIISPNYLKWEINDVVGFSIANFKINLF